MERGVVGHFLSPPHPPIPPTLDQRIVRTEWDSFLNGTGGRGKMSSDTSIINPQITHVHHIRSQIPPMFLEFTCPTLHSGSFTWQCTVPQSEECVSEILSSRLSPLAPYEGSLCKATSQPTSPGRPYPPDHPKYFQNSHNNQPVRNQTAAFAMMR